MSHIKLIFQELRPYHWIKNLLIFAPLLISFKSFKITDVYTLLLLFLAFSLLASSIYIINDIIDRECDKEHPIKKYRPIASKKINLLEASSLICIMLIIVIILCEFFNLGTIIILGGYLVLNLAYSIFLKNLPIIDIFIIAFMYFLRLRAGGEVIDVYISDWLILVTFFFSLFLIVGKRRAEYKISAKSNHFSRKVFLEYNDVFLDNLLAVVIAGTILTYSLYAVEATEVKRIPYLIYSAFFVLFGMFRYLYVIYKHEKGETPERMIFQDIWLFFTVLLWILYIFTIL